MRLMLQRGGGARAAPSDIEQLTRNEQVSGSSPLVGPLFCFYLQRKYRFISETSVFA